MSIQFRNKALTIQHVIATTPKPYAHVKRDLEVRLGRLDDNIRALLKANDIEGVRAGLTAAAGNDGLVIHYIGVHGDWLALEGERKNTTAYLIGNVLYAVQMTKIHFGAGLYAPLRVVVYENEEGGTTFEYDQPSTLFGQFGDADIDSVARRLDDLLAQLLTNVSR